MSYPELIRPDVPALSIPLRPYKPVTPVATTWRLLRGAVFGFTLVCAVCVVGVIVFVGWLFKKVDEE